MTGQKQTFAASINELEEIVQQLEQGEVPLEDAIELYKKGMKLSKYCHEQLTKAEEQLVSVMDEDGNEQPFEQDGEEGPTK